MTRAGRIVTAAGSEFPVLALGLSGAAAQIPQGSTIRQLWKRIREMLLPFSYKVLANEAVVSDADPTRKLRHLEVRFTSQAVG